MASVFNKKAARRISCKKRGEMTLKGEFAGIKIEMCKVDEEQRQIKAKWRLQNGQNGCIMSVKFISGGNEVG